MLEQKMQELEIGKLHAQFNIDSSQLFSLVYQGREYMHPGGKPGATSVEKDKWGNSEIIMFPIVGPANDFRVEIDGQSYPMSQHGITRNWPFALSETSVPETRPQRVAFTQVYKANTPVPNPKYVVGMQEPKELQWPFSYMLTKSFTLDDDALRVEFAMKNFSNKPMPYAFGWHPAFKIGDEATLLVDGNRVTLEDIRAAKGTVLKYPAREVKMATEDRALKLVTDTGYVMLWSPEGSKLLCIEPITRRPSTNDAVDFLAPNMQKKYTVEIKLGEF
jgi:galactose mutarotase-like enzyme